MNEGIFEAQMRNMAGAQQATTRPEHPHEVRSRAWAAAKNRLNEAQAKFAAAQTEECAARAAEEEAWEDLHESSGRIPPRAKPAEPLPYRPLPPAGGFIPTPGLR